jgi:hypothetical protein
MEHAEHKYGRIRRQGAAAGTMAVGALMLTALTGCSTGGLFPSGSSGTSTGSGATTSGSTVARQLPGGVGKGLKFAVDAADKAGFRTFSTHDSSGRMRAQVLYTDWQVCFQTPSGGEHPTSTKVDFGVVKVGESCPAADQGLITTKAGATMPDLRGRSARYASDVLGGNASVRYVKKSGSDAYVLVDSNWEICEQTPAPGEPYAGVPVKLVVAKYSDGGCSK